MVPTEGFETNNLTISFDENNGNIKCVRYVSCYLLCFCTLRSFWFVNLKSFDQTILQT